MTNDIASWSPATNTAEIARTFRGPAFFGAPTVELHPVFDLPPDPSPAPRWSWLTRALAVFVAVDALGLLYVVTQ